MAKIGIVTDSTADMPTGYYEEHNITMVPLIVRFGDDSYKDWIEMPPHKFYPMLRQADKLPKTSQPSVQEFVEAYEKYKDYDHIFSIHLSSKLSGTYQSASIAAENVDVPVTVIDTKLASVGTGMLLREVVAARDTGKSVDEIKELAAKFTGKVSLVFCVDTMKYLEMGGRIGKASALAGSILNIKPILTLEEGVVTPIGKVKGRKKAYREFAEIAKNTACMGPLNAAFVHADAPDAIDELEEVLKQEGVSYNLIMRSEIGCVIGAYTGPGTFAALFYPASERP